MLTDTLISQVNHLNEDESAELLDILMKKLNNDHTPMEEPVGVSHGTALIPASDCSYTVTPLSTTGWNLVSLDLDVI